MSLIDSLRFLVEEGAAVWGFIAAVAIVLVATPLTVRLAPRIGGVDAGGDRPRVHKAPIPRIGGLAIVAGIMIPAFVLIRPEGAYLGILLGTLLIAALGLYDDLRGLSPARKTVGILIAALIPVLGYHVEFGGYTLPLLGNHDFGAFAIPLTLLWIVLLTNLVNLIDGMDALAAGIVAIATLSFAILAASFQRADAAALALIVCGATLAFLRHNYHPAKVFMGDSGALALGFLLATVSVEGVFKTAATITLIAPMLVIAVPLLDTSFVVLKRLKYKRRPWEADQNHFYHRFLRIGFSQRRTAAYLHLWAALISGLALLMRFVPPRPGGTIDWTNTAIAGAYALGLLLLSAWMVYTLEILKARHLQALGFKRFAAPADAAEREAAVEHALEAGAR